MCIQNNYGRKMDRKKKVVIIDKDKKIDYSWLEEFMRKGNADGCCFQSVEKWKESMTEACEDGVWYCFDQSAIDRLRCVVEYYELENRRYAGELRAVERQMRIDPLTGVLNRTGVIQKIEEIIGMKSCEQGALCFLDMDDFKRVNDTYGHSCGDKVLTGLACRLRELPDEEAVVGRFGGDEFLIFLRHTAGREDILKKAAAICRNLEIEEPGQRLSASIGIAVYPDDGETFGELLKKADKALYSSKCHGKNRVMFYSGSPEESEKQ